MPFSLHFCSFVHAGGLFEEYEDSMEAAFRLAVDMVNDDKQTLVRTRLTATPELIPHGDSFKASQKGIYLSNPTLFRNKRFALNEMFQQNASKFAIFYV